MSYSMDSDIVKLSQGDIDQLLRNSLVLGFQKDGKFSSELQKFFVNQGMVVRQTSFKDYLLLEGVPGMNQPCLVRLGKNGDMMTLLRQGQVHCIVTGEDTYCENMLAHFARQEVTGSGIMPDLVPVANLDIATARCALQMLLPEAHKNSQPAELSNRRVYSKYVNLAQRYFATETQVKGLDFVHCAGGIEATVAGHNSDPASPWSFGVDLVQTGTSAAQAGLVPTTTIGTSEAAVVVNRNITSNPEKLSLLNSLFTKIGAHAAYTPKPESLVRLVANVNSDFWPVISSTKTQIDTAFIRKNVQPDISVAQFL
jgi:ATP phosphoribosyltransferase